MYKIRTPVPPPQGGRSTGRFMNEDDWNRFNPDRPYMTDAEGNPIDSRSDTAMYVSPEQRAEADIEFARQDMLAADSRRRSGGLGGGYGKKRVGEESRKQMNLTGSRRSSLLTGRG